MIEVKITGTDEVRRALRRLGDEARASTLEGALRKASEPIVRDAKARAPSPTIARGIQVVNVVVKGEGEVTSEIGLPGGRRDWFHGLFYERGTAQRTTKGRGPVQFSATSRGSMPARPFLRPAFDGNRDRARRIFGEELKRKLERAAGG